MKKRLLTILICIALSSLLCVSAFATGDIGIIGGADGETSIILNDEDIIYGDEFYDDGIYDDYYYDDELYTDDFASDLSELEYIFQQLGEENTGILIAAVVVMLICSLLFLPALVLLIVFAVLNGKLKKKIKEYEMRSNGFQGVQYQQPVNQPYAQPVSQPIPQPDVNPQPIAQPIINGQAVNPAESDNEGGEA